MGEQYPVVQVNIDALRHNGEILHGLCDTKGISVAGSLKFCNGNLILGAAAFDGICNQYALSRTVHLKKLKAMYPDKQVIYTQCPMRQDMEAVVKYADITMQFRPETLFAMDQTASKCGVQAGVLLMMRDGNVSELVECAKITKKLSHLQVKGVGIYRNGFRDEVPTGQAMYALAEGVDLAEQILELPMEIVSAGHSLDVLLNLGEERLPERVNHILLGSSVANPQWLLSKQANLDLRTDALQLIAETLEIHEKKQTKHGAANLNRCRRAVLALGKQDFGNADNAEPTDGGAVIVGCSDDRMVVELSREKCMLKAGETLSFRLNFAGMQRAFTSQEMAVAYCYDSNSTVLHEKDRD